MIQGAKYWDDRERLYVQTNNAIETLVPGLEYCGPSMDVLGCAGLKDIEVSKNQYNGMWVCQPEDYITLYYIDKKNWPLFKKIRPLDLNRYPPNRVPQYHPAAVKAVFGITSEYREDGSFEKIVSLLWAGNAVGLCMKKPGHYICGLAYDDKTKQIGFKDPWPNNRWPDNSVPDQNNNKWFSKEDYNKNIHRWYILYHKV